MGSECIVISTVNAKGGIGKTSLSTNIAPIVSGRGEKRVLFIDMDHQCNASTFFNLAGTPFVKTIFNLMEETKEEWSDAEIQEYIYPTSYMGVDIIPNSVETATLESEYSQNIRTGPDVFLLKDFLSGYISRKYDYVIIDNPPSLGIWTLLSLHCSHFAIIPIEASSVRSLEGLNSAIKVINTIMKSSNPDLRFLRLLLNKVDKRKSSVKHVIERINTLYGEEIAFKNTISFNDIFTESERLKESITRLNPQSSSAHQLRALSKEIVHTIDLIQDHLKQQLLEFTK